MHFPISMQVIAALGLVHVFAPAMAAMTFIAPPDFTTPGEADSFRVRLTGDTMDIIWNSGIPGRTFSVVLYQLNETRAANYAGFFDQSDGPFEYIKRDLSHLDTSTKWVVDTEKDLTESGLFAIATWYDDDSDRTDSATAIFNMQRRTVVTAVTTISRTSSGLGALPTTLDLEESIPSPSTTTLPQGFEESPSGLSMSASIGIAIGVAFAVMIAGLAGWYVARRARRKGVPKAVSDSDGSSSAGEKYHELETDHGIRELDPAIRYELGPGQRTRVELDPESRTRAELDPNPRTREELA